MKDLYRGAKFWRKAPNAFYSSAMTSLGDKLGFFHERYWWFPAGQAREEYQLVEPEILEHLNILFTDTYHPIIYFHLYMIGRSPETAIPTIMLFCGEKDARKKAKKAVDKGGLLEKLPGFRTGHQSSQPMVGPLIQPASGGFSSGNRTPESFAIERSATRSSINSRPSSEGLHSPVTNLDLGQNRRKRAMELDLTGHKNERSSNSVLASQTFTGAQGSFESSAPGVYFDPLRPIARTGMPIFIKKNIGPLRKATANLLFEEQKFRFLSVSHVFSEHVSSIQDSTTDSDSEYDLGSGSETEDDNDFVNATSRASMSSLDSISETCSRSDSPNFETRTQGSKRVQRTPKPCSQSGVQNSADQARSQGAEHTTSDTPNALGQLRIWEFGSKHRMLWTGRSSKSQT